MMDHCLTALATLLALLVCFRMSLQVGQARGRSGITPPAMTGDPLRKRAVPVRSDTAVWPPIIRLWRFAISCNERAAACLGVVRIIGRLVHSAGYRTAIHISPTAKTREISCSS